MIRVKIAAALLKWSGALVEYRVRRIKSRRENIRGNVDGTTLFRSKTLKPALAKYNRIAPGDGESVAIQMVARFVEKHKMQSVELTITVPRDDNQ